MKLEESEFIARDNILVHIKNNLPSSNVEGAEEKLIKKGDKIPKIFVPDFIRHNREFIANLIINEGIPVLTKEQEKEYGLKFEIPAPVRFEDMINKVYDEYDREDLTQIRVEKGTEGFRNWVKEKFGDRINLKKSSQIIITSILKLQEEERKI